MPPTDCPRTLRQRPSRDRPTGALHRGPDRRLRRRARAAQRRSPRRRGRGGGPARAERCREDHCAAHDLGPRAPVRRHHPTRRRGSSRAAHPPPAPVSASPTCPRVAASSSASRSPSTFGSGSRASGSTATLPTTTSPPWLPWPIVARACCQEASSRCSALGRTLARKPRLMLLDEPSLGLAPVIVEGLLPIVSSYATGKRLRRVARRAAHPRRVERG